MGAPVRCRHLAVLMLAVLVALLLPLTGAANGASETVSTAKRTDEPAVTSDLTLVQANILTKLKTAGFQADVAKVLSLQSDFITYNEVPFRTNGVMAPTGYGIYRSMKNRFTAATPVAWRADRWTAIDTGTWRISNWRGKPKGKEVELGRRFANWATLQGVDGRVVSVVSVHVAPPTKGMPDLLRPSINRIGKLVNTLAARGPVLVAGDFNMHYTSGRYPRDLLDKYGMVPSYDVLGSYFPTGDHFGNTIDYVFVRGVDAIAPNSQYPVELRSDHDAVVVGMSWTADLPSQTEVVRNQPTVAGPERRAALASIIKAIKQAEPGSTLVLATAIVDRPRVAGRIEDALARGVHVRVHISGPTVTPVENRISTAIEASADTLSAFSRCVPGCSASWRAAGVPKALVMTSDASGAWVGRYDANRRLDVAILDKPAKVAIATGPVALGKGATLLSAME